MPSLRQHAPNRTPGLGSECEDLNPTALTRTVFDGAALADGFSYGLELIEEL
jgi:hypothetical protein